MLDLAVLICKILAILPQQLYLTVKLQYLNLAIFPIISDSLTAFLRSGT